ncbi:MAG TPA: hypothetical protein ACFYD3_07425 [Candidatus Hypogeohydataceae bacterium YC41]
MFIKENISKLNFRHGIGELAEEVTLTLGTLAGGYRPDQEVSLVIGGQNRDFLVSGLRKELLPQGRVQELNLLSPLSREESVCTVKTQLFLTLSPREYREFQEEYAGKEESLEFRPWIRMGNEFGEGGWDSNSIIKVLADLLGIKIHVSLPAYWVKQFTVKPSTPILKAILELVSPLRPLFYSVQGEVFILAEADMEGTVLTDNRLSLQGVRMVREEIKRGETSARMGRLRLTGNLGRFRPERYKGPLTAEPFQEVQDLAGSVLVSNYCYGTVKESFVTETGSTPFVDVPRLWGLGIVDALIDPDSGVVSNFSLEEVSILRGKDIFGKTAFLLSEQRVVHRYRRTGLNLRPTIYSVQKTIFQYENTHGSFASPREFGNVVGRDFFPRPGRVSSLSLAVFYPYMGQVVFGLYPNLEETHTYYWYSLRGELVAQNTVTVGTVYTDDGQTFRQLGTLDMEDISPGGTLKRVVIRQELVAYYQLNRDSYAVRRETTRLNQQGRYSTSVDVHIVQAGSVQGSPVEHRKMQVYAEKEARGEGLQGSPTLEVAVNTPSWESLETILSLLEERLGRDEVIRTYELFGELNVAPGLQVDMPAFSSLDGTEAIPTSSLSPASVPIVIGCEIEKDALNGTALTRLVVRGRLS